MKIFTVVHFDEDDGVYPFIFSYATREAAVQAIEDHAVEQFNAQLDPNDDVDASRTFPGLKWAGDCAADGDYAEYLVTETELLK